MNPDDVKISSKWREALKTEFLSPYFDALAEQIKSDHAQGKDIFPPGTLIFNAYNSCDPNDVKVVIIGQDPYHHPGEAMGLSFSVPKGVKIPPSLRNIYKELHADVGFEIPDHGDLSHWARQGVLLLNAILTVQKNNAGSHKNIGWQTFTDQTIVYLSTEYDHIVFMLWGNFAKNKKSFIDSSRHLILESAHPSPLAGNAFQGGKHFSRANEYLKAHGRAIIDWQL
ncbi:MAG: uracil-DNA glycosylase [Saprospiraceae bacterium]